MTKIFISKDDSDFIEALHTTFISYCNILNYLRIHNPDSEKLFEDKWAEAVYINSELEKLKDDLGKQYYPNDGHKYTSWEFDFIAHQIIYKE